MSSPKELPLQKLQFYVTTPYTCGYIAKNLAQSLIATPYSMVDADIYSGLIKQGFRRSGKFAYRPHCEHCSACIPVRLILDQFTPTRSQKRAYKQHIALTANVLPVAFHQEHFNLYTQYQALRHPEEALEKNENADEEEQYRQFICQSNVESLMVEFRDSQNQVKIVSIIDNIADGTSAVYTFYNATELKASYGTYAIMWLINWTKQLNLPHLYLGYWIQESQKMTYKEKFNVQEKLMNGEWKIS
ncbi:MAG: arginyltransferase [Methylophilaceae bacterium]